MSLHIPGPAGTLELAVQSWYESALKFLLDHHQVCLLAERGSPLPIRGVNMKALLLSQPLCSLEFLLLVLLGHFVVMLSGSTPGQPCGRLKTGVMALCVLWAWFPGSEGPLQSGKSCLVYD